MLLPIVLFMLCIANYLIKLNNTIGIIWIIFCVFILLGMASMGKNKK